MTKDEEKVTNILLNLSQLAGQMMESGRSHSMKINGKPVIMIDPDWMTKSGKFIAEKSMILSHLMSAIQNENNQRDTTTTAEE